MAARQDQIDRARAIRAAQRIAVGAITTPTAATANAIVLIMPDWTPGKYAIGDLRRYGGAPYRCVQAHDSTANPGWTPDATPALWAPYHGTSVETARPYVAPTGAQDAYAKGEYVIYGGKVYVSKIDANTWTPDAYPQGWTLVA